MSTLQGNAKKYSGAAIDYVLIFDWTTGDCLGKAIPDASGLWTYDYFTDLLCGITYVADGCEPITHGAYSFLASTESALTGFLLLSMAGLMGNEQYPLNKDDRSQPTWSEYFEQVMDIGLHNTVVGAGSLPWESKIIDIFDINWVMKIYGQNGFGSEEDFKWTFEILDAQDSVLFALKAQRSGTYKSSLMYGNNLQSLVAADTVGSYPSTNGELSFTSAGVFYENRKGSNYNASFSHPVNLVNAVKIRVGGEVKTGSNNTGGYIRILPASPVQ